MTEFHYISEFDVVRFIKVRPTAVLPSRATSGSVGYDLTTVESVTLPPQGTALAPTGLALAKDLPITARGAQALLILPRSSLFLKYRVLIPNSPGLIDTDYTGEIKVILYNPTSEQTAIPAGTRIAQAVFVTVDFPMLIVQEDATARVERGGFGSTGT